MNRKEIEEQFEVQNKIFTDKVHSMIAENLGIKKLYSQSNLWCEVTEIDLKFGGKITISSTTFKYTLYVSGHEMLDYKFGRSINNAPEYKSIKKGDIESHSTDFRGLIETTNNLLKSIMSVKTEIISLLKELIGHDYNI